MARLLCFSDVHSNHRAARALVQRAPDVDVVVGAGDFCDMRRGLDRTIGILSDIDTPTVLVPGNAESAEELEAACTDWEASHVLHGSGATVGGVSFYGIGGGIPVTPFGAWSWDVTEGQAATLLADCPDDAVLIAHSPPNGTVDRDSGGRSLGSTSIRDAIQRTAPRLVVCGHIHNSWGQTGTIGSTTVLNAGPDGVVREV
ncbi:MAG: metallophosphoesterase family protein [Longimonas sp.]|uniref:metallophosphoesterase family protein n=1 Tax=Longimonas sp. TaxID=2039626 RepID=UPI0039765018